MSGKGKMGYFHQLRMMLWKNFTLKKRTPFVLLVEVSVPLVLFVVLLGIRKKQPATSWPSSYHTVQPLPSAGITAIMQAFCDGGYPDDDGFEHYPQSSLHSFLQNLQDIAHHNNFFEPSFSLDDMDHIPALYRSIIDDPAALHDAFKNAKNVELSDMFSNITSLERSLEQNFSLPAQDVNTLLHAKVNFTEVYRLLFGSSNFTSSQLFPINTRHKRSLSQSAFMDWLDFNRPPEHARHFQDSFSNIFDGPGKNAIKDIVNNLPMGGASQHSSGLNPFDFIPSSSMNQQPFFNGLIYKTILKHPELLKDPEVLKVVAKLLGFDPDSYIDPLVMVDVLKKLLLTADNLHTLTCTDGELETILLVDDNSTHDLEDMSHILCNMTDEQWEQFANLILQHTSSQDIVYKLHLDQLDFDKTEARVKEFYKNIIAFTEFEKNLIMLNEFASKLPNSSCTAATVEPPVVDPDTNTNSTNSTHSTNNGHHHDSSHHHDKHSHHRSRRSTGSYGGLLQVWMAMQHTVCGKDSISQQNLEKFTQTGNMDDLHISGKLRNQLGILIHVLFGNPKVLYAPNNTEADTVIQKANATFALVDTISEYARKWLNVSGQIKEYLEKNTTEPNLNSIREMQTELQSLPGIGHLIKDPTARQFLLNGSVPNSTFFLHQLYAVDNAACSWLELLKGISLNVFQGFATEEELVEYFLHHAYADGKTVLASLVFDNMHENGSLPAHVKYRIRQNATFTQTTLRVRDKYWYPGPHSWGYKYYQFGFVWIQDVVERAIVDLHAGRDVVEPGSYIQQMPYPCFKKDQFLFMIEHVMPLCLTVSWVYSVAMLVQSIVYEKEQRLKEVMKMMGLNNSVHWLAWFITMFSQMTVTMITLTIMLKFGQVLMYSNAVIIFLVLEIFAMATISFSFLVSACYSKAKVAAACAGIVYFLSYVPYMYVAIREEAAGDQIPAWTKSLASLMSTTAFGLGAKYFAFYEIEGVGIQWDNLNVSPVEGDKYNLAMVIIMMVFDTFLYILLTWYIENVHPGSYGLPKPWYFPFTWWYWCGHHQHTETEQCSWRRCWNRRRRYGDLSVMEEDQACAMEGAQSENRCNFEPEPSHIPLGVKIDNLKKVYKNGKLAVNNLSLNLFEGQITSFLGHNGAGKTTTMSILTGMFPPTGGFATVYGLDIRSDMEDIRKSLGMCPQHNVLFDKLTVEEHLWFYARLKGMSQSDIKEEMDTMIEDIGLPKKRHNTVDCLSGGMKRKLSVAIAFVAGSRTVILDEPTAGVDPYARRDIWDLLIKYKQERTILLSTHHMDEADLLGDRIAIISNGQIKCCGTSLFLKSTFGEGYHLILVKKPSEPDIHSAETIEEGGENFNQSFHTKCTEEKVSSFIQKHIASAYLKTESSQELHYILPFEGAKKGYFEKLFKAMDKDLDKLEISSYGVVDTSLEEVFLKVTEKALQSPEEENEKNETKELGFDLNSSSTRENSPAEQLVDVDTTPGIPAPARPSQCQEVTSPLSFTPGTVNVELGNLINLTDNQPDHAPPPATLPAHLNPLMTGSGCGSLSDICESSTPPSTDSSLPASLTHQPKLPGAEVSQESPAHRPTHQRSPSDESLHRLLSGPPPAHRSHRRTPSDISLRTLAAIRGTYHKRTASDVSIRIKTHQRSSSDGSAAITNSPARQLGHQRTASNVSNSSSLLDITEPPKQCSIGIDDDISLLSAEERYNLLTEGKGSYVLEGSQLAFQQFFAIIVKRYYYIRRNWKGLFSQILLPALFVCIAMTVALTAPTAEDLPPITLSPSQYYNYTQPEGNFIPYHYHDWSGEESIDAGPKSIIQTFRLPSGVAATCLLKSPYNSSFDMDVLKQINSTNRNYKLVADYFTPSCESVFVKGLRLENFVPPAPTATPTKPPTDAENATSLDPVPVTMSPAHTPKYYPHCHCSVDNTGQVCEKTGFSMPPSYQTVTSDILQDITGNNEERFYLYTTDIYRLHRYGGFSFGLHRDYVPEDFGKDAPTEFRRLGVRHASKVWYNHKGYHAIPVYINTLNNAILRANLPKEKGNPAAYGITAVNHPMNDTNTVLSLEAIEQGSDVLIAIFIIVAMSFVPASFVVFLVYEKSIKAKHLQFVSGINRVIYWLANYAWDMANYLVPALCCIIILRSFDIPAYVSPTNFPAVISLFMLYGWSITPMMYPASFWFDEPSTAYIALIVINLFIGITCIITSFLLEMFQQNDKDLQAIHEYLKNVFLIFPNYCLGRGLMDIAFNEYRNEYYFKIGAYDEMKSPFEWKLMARNLVAMAAMGFIFFIITLLCEFRFFYRPKRVSADEMLPVVDEDDDVAAERRRVLRGAGRRDMLRLQNLTKVYKTRKLGRHLAVDRLTLGVPQGECFGLLGVNGAGKTTTFKMLTGDHKPSGGDAMLNDYSVLRNLHKVQQSIGYCPQFDALYDELTPREHIQLYARLRGVPCLDQAKVVNWALEKLSLEKYADRLAGTLSGGNKRKLSTAIALIGHPPVIFLDEPTTGMDPHSRRFLWDLILDLIKCGRSVILTSHSMEECEALCTRLAIMVNGTFKCLGSVQHLKNRFGDGYTVSVRVKGPNYEREVTAVERYISRHFPNSKHKGSHHNMVQYELSSGSLSLAHVFSTMENAQRDLQIEDYSVSQNTLDNVFINFVEEQRELVEESLESLTTTSSSRRHSDEQPLNAGDPDLDLETDDIPAVATAAGTRLAFLQMDIVDA